ncbi:MAG: hypothetical protein AAF702_31285 [Chloroflexota bacterium]
MTITVKLLKDSEGAVHFQALQRIVWDSPEDDLVPTHVSITIATNGGGLLGAYADDGPIETGRMVGVAIWWLGIDDPAKLKPGQPNSLKVCSHMAGVLPEWQGKGIGRMLKFAQREHVLEQGLTNRITWTYDPLFVANGIFNIHRLGAVCNTYYTNYYGEMRDGLNRGTPSDRCQVDWMLNSQRVVEAAQGKPREREWSFSDLQILPTESYGDDFRKPAGEQPALNGRPIALPLPSDISRIRNSEPELSLTWRLYFRDVLVQSFDAGYSIVDCVPIQDRGHHYILTTNNQ